MKKTVAEKWVKALRSKKYKQAKSVLKIKNKAGVVRHCCLGVLCELYQQDMRKKKRKPLPCKFENAHDHDDELPKTSKICAFASTRTHLPEQVQKWAGMRSEDGELQGEEINVRGIACWNLTSINDYGASFKTIATVIENSVKDL